MDALDTTVVSMPEGVCLYLQSNTQNKYVVFDGDCTTSTVVAMPLSIPRSLVPSFKSPPAWFEIITQ